ncbi:hypothetical protein PMIN01_12803 [Paraphaeosphaeria minitans]|uniref:Uncharacterized protein n=1 Tax=Paraphaeosphaeria minitans TaxID=565426 RepID=A0A9P6KJ84_9PLEO|nr:hypothetical protein PMIN01_12803 [Paraphaeosphaeria minitans]
MATHGHIGLWLESSSSSSVGEQGEWRYGAISPVYSVSRLILNTKPRAWLQPGLAIALFSSLAVDVTQGYNAALLLQLFVEHGIFPSHPSRDPLGHRLHIKPQPTCRRAQVKEGPGQSARDPSERCASRLEPASLTLDVAHDANSHCFDNHYHLSISSSCDDLHNRVNLSSDNSSAVFNYLGLSLIHIH